MNNSDLADGVRAATCNSPLPAVFARSTVGQWAHRHADGLIAAAWIVGSMGCLFLGAWWSGRR